MLLQIIDPQFPLGMLHVTSTLLEALGDHAEDALQMALNRHATCDWGELDGHDRRVNDAAFHYGGRLLSAYDHQGQHSVVRYWIITEADRSATTALLPEDY